MALVVVAAALTPARGSAEGFTQCYGNPPRQTPNPISAPCVPYFDGDNGGNTFQGVTGDEIKIVLYNDLGLSGDVGSGTLAGDEALARTVEVQLAYHQRHYQTYDRVVRVIAVPSVGGHTSTTDQRRTDAETILAHEPFAVLYVGDQDPSAIFDETSQADVPVLGLMRHMDRQVLAQHAPYAWTFLADRQTEIATSSSFICQKLAHRPARFSSDPEMQKRPRRFAVLAPLDPGARLFETASDLVVATKTACDADIDLVPYPSDVDAIAMRALMLGLKARRVTTVACYCEAPTASLARIQAPASLYGPEWYWDDATGVFSFDAGTEPFAALQSSFGVSQRWRSPVDQPDLAMQAYIEESPSSSPDARWNPWVYQSAMLLFEAVQTAGPNLTPQSVEQGLYTFRSTRLDLNRAPAGGFGPYGERAIGDRSWIDTAMAWWWDARPSEGDPTGCTRVGHSGRRAFPWGWQPGDADLFVAGDGCTADVLPGLSI